MSTRSSVPSAPRWSSFGDVRAKGFDAARWTEFRRLGQDLHDCLVPHAQKEDMVLLPMLDDLMDPKKEMQLYEKYIEHM